MSAYLAPLDACMPGTPQGAKTCEWEGGTRGYKGVARGTVRHFVRILGMNLMGETAFASPCAPVEYPPPPFFCSGCDLRFVVE